MTRTPVYTYPQCGYGYSGVRVRVAREYPRVTRADPYPCLHSQTHLGERSSITTVSVIVERWTPNLLKYVNQSIYLLIGFELEYM